MNPVPGHARNSGGGTGGPKTGGAKTMNVLQIVLFALVGAFLVALLRDIAPTVGFALTLMVAATLFLVALSKVAGILAPVERLASEADVNIVFFATVVKIIGIAYVAEFGAGIARDAGVEAVAGKIELVGKLFIVALAVPILSAVVDTVTRLLP